jgi:hypothetical protein
MEVDSELNLEVFPRPVTGADPTDQRLLWYWNPSSEEVEIAPNGESLLVVSEFGEITLPQMGAPVPPALQVAYPLADELGEHIHFLRYLLDDSPAASVGGYGFFARVTSPSYMASDPFLVVLNNGVSASQIESAARAINAAAVGGVAGDYNHDGSVNAADYTVWRDTLGTTADHTADGSGNGEIDAADYDVWLSNFSARGASSNRFAQAAASVPEPSSWLLAAVCGFTVVCGFAAAPRRGARL